MNDSIRLGRIAGIPVGTNWSLALLAVAMVRYIGFDLIPQYVDTTTFTTRMIIGLVGTLGFLASILAHEFGHALVARNHGVPVEGITLWFLGGAAKLGGISPSPQAEFRIAAAGPAVNLVLSVVFGAAAYLAPAIGAPDAVRPLLVVLTIVNLFVLAIGNMIPAAPLDGGRVLAAVVWKRTGDRARAIATSAWIGVVIGAAFTLFSLWRLFVVGSSGVLAFADLVTALTGVFIMVLARQELGQAQQRRLLREHTTASIMQAAPPVLHNAMTVGGALDAVAHLPHKSFSVDNHHGQPVGIVTRKDLLDIPMWDRQTQPLSAHVVFLGSMESAFPDETLEDVAHRVFDSPNHLIAVGDGSGAVLGTIDLPSLNAVMSPDNRPERAAV